LFVVQSTRERATPSEISRWLLREPHSTSGLITRMEKDGLVTKVDDLERKNMLRVAMTEKGREAYEKSTDRESIQMKPANTQPWSLQRRHTATAVPFSLAPAR